MSDRMANDKLCDICKERPATILWKMAGSPEKWLCEICEERTQAEQSGRKAKAGWSHSQGQTQFRSNVDEGGNSPT
jgi:protein-arginine kinase activator protein McsA